MGCRRGRVVTFTAIRLRGLGFKPPPGRKFENENFCFRRIPAVVKACHPCRVRPIKTPLYKTYIPNVFISWPRHLRADGHSTPLSLLGYLFTENTQSVALSAPILYLNSRGGASGSEISKHLSVPIEISRFSISGAHAHCVG